MEQKIASRIMLMLLLTSTLTLAFNIQQAKAELTHIINVPFHYQMTTYYCGPACLEMVFDYYGEDISQLEIAEAAGTRPYTTYAIEMMRAAHFSNISTSSGPEMPTSITGYTLRQLGYATLQKWSMTISQLKALIDDDYPIILLMWYSPSHFSGHYRVAVGYNNTHIILHDPWPGQGPNFAVDFSTFLDLWSYYGYWGLFTSPWNIKLDIPSNVKQENTFTVTATATYPCPTPFSTSDYPASMTNATIMLPQGISLSSGETTKKPLGPGTMPAGNSATVSWTVQADNPGVYEIGIQAEGKIKGYWYQDRIGGFASCNVTVVPASTHASVDSNPDTLNFKSKEKWITTYIQLPEGYNPEDIDASTIMLNGTIQPILDPKYDFVTNSSEYLADHDNDGILERMVKFRKTDVASWIHDDLGMQCGNVTLTVTGELYDGTSFEATDTLKVLFPGDADDDGDVDFDDFIILAGCYSCNTETPINQLADFNEDGTIDFDDFIILAGNYGKTAV